MKYSMLDYIQRQPEILTKAYNEKELFLNTFDEIFTNNPIKRIYFVGSGTSFHVSSLGAIWFNKYLNVEASAHFPTIFVEEKINKTKLYKNNEILVLATSQSGNSTSTIKAIQYAKQLGFITACLCEDVHSDIAPFCNYMIKMPVEKEMVPPETQGYTGAILAMYMAAIYLANKDGLISDYENKLAAILDMVHLHMPRAINITKMWIDRNRYILSKAHKISICGSNLNYITALEGALKAGETMKRVVHGYESEEFCHLFDLSFEEEDYLFAILHDTHNYKRNTDIINLVKQITNRVFVITNTETGNPKDCYYDFYISDDLSPFYYVIPFQMIGAIISEYLGVDTSKYPYDDLESIAHSENCILYKKN